ncbi:Hsp20/alpha crystallin family protein [Mycobacterium xenopi]|uniref:Heat-shock protein Hsp20 n=2 Tax=Mycobacterium xenopi TaxID=1789 RepID=A0AAD1H1Z5_MYCXE|nr:Hsp20/alpha crystallin family protein [Mycobacterium xenopi]EUA08751.1 hsp20/alpha crystallin family protein [Mycobacterium xenopi 4042]MDA3637923.1 Hsp20/alpha crystallin family protein [Mycobacterium xenopi]MDA3660690.1 Hsp20/alpha crystallin family protein [Mycobacterium xenopi]ORX09596.1 heat-shock protein Hsp20 [Mycobacterium xenopi]SPX88626.1 Hsp [Mycobacterium xenopi]
MTDLTVWSPPSWSNLLRRPSPFTEFDNWLREMFGVSGEGTGAFAPAAEVARDGDDAVIRIELPGVDVDNDVNVEVEGNRLVIHGERRDERAEEKEGRTVREIRYGSFSRTFTLPSHVTGDAISASYDKGVLTVRVAGAYKGTQKQRIAISK